MNSNFSQIRWILTMLLNFFWWLILLEHPVHTYVFVQYFTPAWKWWKMTQKVKQCHFWNNSNRWWLSIWQNICFSGCFDGFIYFLCALDGKVHWKVQTDDAVKCTGCALHSKPRIVIGSHDYMLYYLDYQVRTKLLVFSCAM